MPRRRGKGVDDPLILRVLIDGWILLVAAILLNFLAHRVGLSTWYDFLGRAMDSGFWAALTALGVLNLAFLFLLYPGVLGAVIRTLGRAG